MKKQYIKPVTEGVKVALYGSVLGGIGVEGGSPVTPIADAKENNLLFEDDAWDNDLWGDSDNNADSYDTWKE